MVHAVFSARLDLLCALAAATWQEVRQGSRCRRPCAVLHGVQGQGSFRRSALHVTCSSADALVCCYCHCPRAAFVSHTGSIPSPQLCPRLWSITAADSLLGAHVELAEFVAAVRAGDSAVLRCLQLGPPSYRLAVDISVHGHPACRKLPAEVAAASMLRAVGGGEPTARAVELLAEYYFYCLGGCTLGCGMAGGAAAGARAA